MPLLSEVGADRKDSVNRINRYIREFEIYGAEAIAIIPASKRNIKLNLIKEAFFDKENPHHDFQDPSYGQVDTQSQPTLDQVLTILKIPESREIFGFTFRDLIDMDQITLEKIEREILDLNKQRAELQSKEEKKYET